MKCTLVDTGPLVAVLDHRDGMHATAVQALSKLPEPRLLCPSVMTEALYLLGRGGHARLHQSLERDVFQLRPLPSVEDIVRRALSWMTSNEAHEPDFNDAFLIAWHERESGSRVWTFDSEFTTTWRTSRGKLIKLA